MRTARGVRPQRKRKSIILRLALAAFAVYVVATVVMLQIQLHEKREQLKANEAEIHRLELLNEDTKEKQENSDAYLEEEARNQGYIKDGEQVYIVAPEE